MEKCIALIAITLLNINHRNKWFKEISVSHESTIQAAILYHATGARNILVKIKHGVNRKEIAPWQFRQ